MRARHCEDRHSARASHRARASHSARAPGAAQPCSATCSLADGNAHATCSRRSWRKLKRSWLGGRSPSGRFGRYVAHGPASVTAHSMFCLKKQPSHDTFRHPGHAHSPSDQTPLACGTLPAALDARRAAIKARSPPRCEPDSRKTQHFRNFFFSLLLAGLSWSPAVIARIFRSFRSTMRILVTGVTGAIGSRLAPDC